MGSLLGMLAETPVHPGAGRSMGVVDLPVAREAATDLPVIVGSSLKGALRDRARQVWGNQDDEGRARIDAHFGERDGAGNLLVSDARLLLLPVRSLTGQYRWATCPLILERLRRDLQRIEMAPAFVVPTVEERQVLTAGQTGSRLFLEERQFEIADGPDSGVVATLKRLIKHAPAGERLERQLAILHDDDFVWFARYGLAVQARNQLDETKKTSKNLWYEETLPADTVMYSVLVGRHGQGMEEPLSALLGQGYLQVGGNETVGQGWFAVTLWGGGAG